MNTHCSMRRRAGPKSNVISRFRIAVRYRGFTVVELLVVISIITILIALLLPALVKARRLALHIACSANVRSLTLQTLMYTDEYDGVLMSNGPYTYMVKGAYSRNDTSLMSFFHSYLGVSKDFRGNLLGWNGVGDNLVSGPPPELICPAALPWHSAGRPLPGWPLEYAYYTGSAFGPSHPYALRLNTLQDVRSPYWNLAVLWGDRYCPPAAFGGQDGYALPTMTNHPGDQVGVDGGGNVGRVDGSVIWMAKAQNNTAASVDTTDRDKYIVYGGWNQCVALPSGTVFMPTDANENVTAPYVITPEGNLYHAFSGLP